MFNFFPRFFHIQFNSIQFICEFRVVCFFFSFAEIKSPVKWHSAIFFRNDKSNSDMYTFSPFSSSSFLVEFGCKPFLRKQHVIDTFYDYNSKCVCVFFYFKKKRKKLKKYQIWKRQGKRQFYRRSKLRVKDTTRKWWKIRKKNE